VNSFSRRFCHEADSPRRRVPYSCHGGDLMPTGMHGSEERWPRSPSNGCGRWRGLSVLLAVSEWVLPYARRSIPSIRCSRLSSPSWCPQLVEWNRGPLGPLAKHPLKDKRVRVETGDVAVKLSSRLGQFDAVLVDVDNGPAH